MPRTLLAATSDGHTPSAAPSNLSLRGHYMHGVPPANRRL